MNERLIIIGAGGHAKVCAEIAALNGYETIIYLDDNDELYLKEQFIGVVTGKTKDVDGLDGDVFVAIGDSIVRERFLNYLNSQNRNIITLIHPKASVSDFASIASGVAVMAGAVVNPTSVIGEGSIINTCSSVDHDCYIDANSHIAVGAHLCGGVHIGKNCWIGAGATIINNVYVTNGVTIGAGAVVVNDINEPGTYIGVPARKA